MYHSRQASVPYHIMGTQASKVDQAKKPKEKAKEFLKSLQLRIQLNLTLVQNGPTW